MRLGSSNVSTGRDGIPSAAAPGVLRQSGTPTSPIKANQGVLRPCYSRKHCIFGKVFPLCFLRFLLFKLFGCGLPRCDFATLRLKPAKPRQVIHPLPRTRSAPSRGVSARSGARRVKPCQSQSNHKKRFDHKEPNPERCGASVHGIKSHVSKWQKMTRPPGPDPASPLSAVLSPVLAAEAPAAGAKVEAPPAGAKVEAILSTKAPAAVDGEGGNRVQSCPIVHNRG